MRDTLPNLRPISFPALRRGALHTLQVNLGYVCNLQCVHCHVAAGPRRTEAMTRETVDAVLGFLRQSRASGVRTLDLTGGAPELNAHFRELVVEARALGVHVMDRCNLTVLEEPGQEDLADFLASHQVEVVASLPCYLEDNVDKQRGNGVFESSIRGLQTLNALGYGGPGSGLTLNLVYNPLGPSLPPPQVELEQDYRDELGTRFGITFNSLFALANMPIKRFGSMLLSLGQFDQYMALLQGAHREENLDGVMCRGLVSVDWQGYVYDCDFNQMLGLPLRLRRLPMARAASTSGPAAVAPSAVSPIRTKDRVHLTDLIGVDLENNPIVVAGHCYGCTAGQGSSCGGALA
ncbi:MAG: Radical SAM [uncultured Chloroflexi bacterium]|uniref:Radical SAM n=1 Tax=uncultured Chloroflexota bacterium TaxID=166587 RepID=A0A6J4HHU2_9CHLR|nr:MAG: Radical SAM [uncultured Chloroflexota bacterium]